MPEPLRAVPPVDAPPKYGPRDALELIRQALDRNPEVAEMRRIPTRASSGALVETLVLTFRDGHSVFVDIEGERP